MSAFNWFVHYAWLIPLLPFASAVVILSFGKRTPGKGAAVGIAAVVRGVRVLDGRALELRERRDRRVRDERVWFRSGRCELQLGIFVDGLTAVMLVVVTSVSLMVQIYSLGYMKGDDRYTWFYFVLSMFTGAMLIVVVSSNVIELLVGWEIMGVCSYLLIGHWYEERQNSNAAIKAFITTRIGDVPMMFGFFCLIAATGFTTTNINETTEAIVERGREHGLRRCRRAAAVRRHDRQVGPVPAARVAARRDGGSHAGQRPDPRRHDGRRRRLPDRAAVRGLRRGRARSC